MTYPEDPEDYADTLADRLMTMSRDVDTMLECFHQVMRLRGLLTQAQAQLPKRSRLRARIKKELGIP